MLNHFDVLIVGGGHSGAQAAAVLRRQKFPGCIAIVSEEASPPYERPPLSKEYLAGQKSFDQLLFRSPKQWADLQVELLLGQSVTSVDPGAGRVRTADGHSIGYGKLIWAAGGRPRGLSCSGSELTHVHTVRGRSDADKIKERLASVRRAVVIGGGYIGLEAAGVLRGLDVAVALVEGQDRVLARVSGEPLSAFYQGEHQSRGVDLRLNATVDCIDEENGRLSSVRLSDGSVLLADLVIVGIGIEPSVEPLTAAGAATGNGVRVDEHCRTSLPNIYAVGDCAEHRNRFAGGDWIRLESVQNANDQAATAAKDISRTPEPYAAMPWFWSNQYDLRLQTIGLSRGYDELVVRGDPADRSFSVVYLRAGRVIALDCVNSTRDYAQGRLLIAQGAAPDIDQLADRTAPLKSLID